ncbi:Glycosyltransferase involved in cell wall bisynthesis [Micrococcus terreus]|uniref:Glycosyltransferase involved in cell wall bisynthesis n=2 Tax=Micrococcus terreus TaxID=574650 RepID=A0A1I7ME34_9MICC|nr:Glycosyltransferase involved in cell wall bisynthesis [Micrococcus terreus]
MHIHMVSGIFVSPDEFRNRNLQETMETILADGLRDRGIEVTTGGHSLTDNWKHADIVHIHHLANACLRLFRPPKQKIVFTRHATKDIPLHHRLVLAQTYRVADALVVLSDSERHLAATPQTHAKLHMIHNGVNPEFFAAVRRTQPLAPEPFRMLYVGQLIELKRVEIAVQLVANLRAKGHNVKLDIAYHRATLESRLMDLVQQLGITDSVTFLGPLNRQELGSAMHSAHLLVHPSRTEALPTVVTEAGLTGLPVAAFNVGGIREQVYAPEQLPPPHDIDSFYSLTTSIIENYDHHSQLASEHARIVRNRFSVDAMIDGHIRLYESLL